MLVSVSQLPIGCYLSFIPSSLSGGWLQHLAIILFICLIGCLSCHSCYCYDYSAAVELAAQQAGIAFIVQCE